MNANDLADIKAQLNSGTKLNINDYNFDDLSIFSIEQMKALLDSGRATTDAIDKGNKIQPKKVG